MHLLGAKWGFNFINNGQWYIFIKGLLWKLKFLFILIWTRFDKCIVEKVRILYSKRIQSSITKKKHLMLSDKQKHLWDISWKINKKGLIHLRSKRFKRGPIRWALWLVIIFKSQISFKYFSYNPAKFLATLFPSHHDTIFS